jgi:hypothetical protein
VTPETAQQGARQVPDADGTVLAARLPVTTLAWPFTLPMGLWGLLVLVKKSVRAGFAWNLERGGVGTIPVPRPTGPVRRRARGFLRSLWANIFTTHP